MRHVDRRLRSLLAASALSFVALASHLAWADGVAPGAATADQKKQALDHFDEGKKAIEAKDWDKAISELRASLDVVNSPNARLELARSLRDSGKLGDAWNEYQRVILDATQLAASEPRYAKTADAASSESAEIEPKVAFVTVTVTNAPENAGLTVAGRSIPPEQWASPIVAPEGPVEVVLTDASGKPVAHQTVTAKVGAKTPVELTGKMQGPLFNPTPEEKPPPVKEAPPPPPPPPARSKLRPWAYVAGGVGVAGLGVFTVAGLMSSSAYSDLKSSCPAGNCPASKANEISSGRTQQTVANVGLAVGIVGVAAGATLFVVSLGGRKSNAAALVLTPSWVGVRGSL